MTSLEFEILQNVFFSFFPFFKRERKKEKKGGDRKEMLMVYSLLV